MRSLHDIAIVGEDNPLSSDPSDALVPWPRLCAGHRLLGILGVDEDCYLAMDRRNLCNPTWQTGFANAEARRLIDDEKHALVIALGAKVSTAFNVALVRREKLEKFRWASTTKISSQHSTTILHLPHPSGRNTIWNMPSARKRAIDVLRELRPSIPWGSVQHR